LVIILILGTTNAFQFRQNTTSSELRLERLYSSCVCTKKRARTLIKQLQALVFAFILCTTIRYFSSNMIYSLGCVISYGKCGRSGVFKTAWETAAHGTPLVRPPSPQKTENTQICCRALLNQVTFPSEQ